MPFATHKGLRVGYDVAGEGAPALLLLPGWCDNRTQFHSLLPIAAQKRRVLAMDLPGHGSSEAPQGEFGLREVVAAAAAVVEASGARQVVPVTVAHSGWAAIGLRRRLGAERIPRLVLLDWIVLDPPRAFLETLQTLQVPERWKSARAQLLTLWLSDADPEIAKQIQRTMSDYGPGMWARAAREIAAAYAREGNPLRALSALDPPTPTLHLYALPKDERYWADQAFFAKRHPWFRARRLGGKTHFPALETPEAVVSAIEEFLASSG
jgi:pimeloyl-ACP methyl ester carboxylesterase